MPTEIVCCMHRHSSLPLGYVKLCLHLNTSLGCINQRSGRYHMVVSSKHFAEMKRAGSLRSRDLSHHFLPPTPTTALRLIKLFVTMWVRFYTPQGFTFSRTNVDTVKPARCRLRCQRSARPHLRKLKSFQTGKNAWHGKSVNIQHTSPPFRGSVNPDSQKA